MALSLPTINLILQSKSFNSMVNSLPKDITFADLLNAAKILSRSINFNNLDLFNKFYELNMDQVAQILLIFKHNTNIKKIELGNCEINDDIAKILTDIIDKNSDLEQLSLFETQIKCNNSLIGNELISSLKLIPHLKSFDIQSDQMTNEELISILNSIKENPNLVELSIADIQLEINGIEAICDLLNKKQITKLTLEKNNIDDTKLCILTESIKNCSTLKIVSITHNEFGDRGTIALAESLGEFKLTILDLNNNEIKDQGAEAISKIIKNMPDLILIDMSYNKITDNAINIIFQSLSANNNLEELLLSNNPIKDATLEELCSWDEGVDLEAMSVYLDSINAAGEVDDINSDQIN